MRFEVAFRFERVTSLEYNKKLLAKYIFLLRYKSPQKSDHPERDQNVPFPRERGNHAKNDNALLLFLIPLQVFTVSNRRLLYERSAPIVESGGFRFRVE